MGFRDKKNIKETAVELILVKKLVLRGHVFYQIDVILTVEFGQNLVVLVLHVLVSKSRVLWQK